MLGFSSAGSLQSLVQQQTSQQEVVVILVALIVAASVVGIVSHYVRLPYTVLLVIVGVGMSLLGLVPQVRLTQDLLMNVFLPALLFEASFHFPARELRQFALSIGTLAILGVLLTAVLTALVLQVEFSTFGVDPSLGFLHFLLFGTLIAATDPISVIALLRQLGVERRLAVLIEGESLFNDGTAIVLFLVVLQALVSGSFSAVDSLKSMTFVSLGGIFVGLTFGLFARFALTLARDHLLAIAMTTVAAYGSYLLAQQFNVSGVLSTVFAGLVVGNTGAKGGLGPSVRVAVVSFWEYAGFFVTSLVFLLMGLELDMPWLLSRWQLIVLAFCAVAASRIVAVFLPLPLLHRFGQPLSLKRATVLWWGGLRGALSMVLVLSLPETLPGRDTLIAMTYGVVVLSVVVQGSTMGVLLRLIGLTKRASESQAFLSTSLARLRAIDEQQRALKRMYACDVQASQEIAKGLQRRRQAILDELRQRQQDPTFAQAMQEHKTYIETQLHEVARQSYRDALLDDLITDHQAAELTQELIEGNDKGFALHKDKDPKITTESN
ncbi:MAG: sodium:proton antiporter [Myxococcota bacterium]